jgi:tetratricopeptide (TPR) repeat protein
MIGSTIGHYRVLALLGRGAMGEVYLAFDEHLQRKVALKVQPEALAGDRDRRHHLEREARALGALNHPGIVAVHGIERHGDVLLLATEFVDGSPLGTLIPPEGMPFDEIVRIGTALAEAVGAAHRQGIIHRDLKPSNVMVTAEGAVKVLDFGLAKIRSVPGGGAGPDGTGSGTLAGTIVGTAHYMSPEQAQGLPVDARSDIFSLGVVLFHMATGRRPFEGETPLAILSSIIKDTPPPVTDVRPDLPAAFARLVARCLEKDPGRRVQDSVDLAAHLREVATERPLTPEARKRRGRVSWETVLPRARWPIALVLLLAVVAAGWRVLRPPASPAALDSTLVAVAPFENRTNDRALDAVGLMAADRIAEGLTGQLSLRVVPGPVALEAWLPASAGGTRDRQPDRVELLARRVGAAVVVSGDYYTVAGELAFRVRITNARDHREIAQFGPVTGRLDAPGEAVEKVRQYVVGEAAVYFKGAGGIATAGIPPDFAPTGPPMSYEVYQEFLRGLDASGRDPRTAVIHFERVEELYPHRALVLPWLVLSYMRLGDFARAERYVELVARRIAPEDRPLVQYFQARLSGRWVDAYDAIRRLHRSMPQHVPTVNATAGAALAIGRPREALALLSSVDVSPWLDSSSGQSSLSMRAEAEHMLRLYEDERQDALKLAGVAPEAVGGLVRSLAALGRADEIPAVLERSQVARGRGTPVGQLIKQAAEELRAHSHLDASRAMALRGLEWLDALDAAASRSVANRQLRGDLLSLLDRWREALALFRELANEQPHNVSILSGVGIARARLGDAAGAERVSEELMRLERPYLFGAQTYGRARIAAALRQKDRAVALLLQAFTEGQVIVWRTHVDPAFDALRGNESFDRVTALTQEPPR